MADVINADLSRVHTTQQFQLGAKYTEDRDTFRYIQYNEGDGAVDGVAGQLVIGLDSGYPDWEVTMDFTEGGAIAAILTDPRGFLQVAMTDGQFGWIQTGGRNRVAALTDGGVAQGHILRAHAVTDGGLDTYAEDGSVSGFKRIGVALEDDAATALAIGTMRIELETSE